MARKQVKDSPPENFENSMKRLEEIVDTLEQGAVSLDEVMALYEEGVNISKRCLERLQQAEVTLKRLSKSAGGTFEITDEPGE